MLAELNRASTRVAALLLCLGLAACSGGSMFGTPPTADSGASPARTGGVGTGARGGASTASARGEPVEVPPDPVTQARATCWMKVESQKQLRGIDQRIGYVDKCVAEQIKTP